MHNQTKASILLVASLGLTITTLSLSYQNYQLRNQLEENPTCQKWGHKGYTMSAYNAKHSVLMIQCSDNPSAGAKLRPSYPLPAPRKRTSIG